jgi:hypothetical protein
MILVTTMFPDMPGQFWLIGIACLIIGALILTYAYLKYRTSEPVSERAISGEEEVVTDEEMRRSFRINIAMFIAGWAVAAISAPFVIPDAMRGGFTMSMGTFSLGTGIGLVGTFFIFMYMTNREWYRNFLTKRKQKKKKK